VPPEPSKPLIIYTSPLDTGILGGCRLGYVLCPAGPLFNGRPWCGSQEGTTGVYDVVPRANSGWQKIEFSRQDIDARVIVRGVSYVVMERVCAESRQDRHVL
jgi:hypothetical protein